MMLTQIYTDTEAFAVYGYNMQFDKWFVTLYMLSLQLHDSAHAL